MVKENKQKLTATTV